MARLQLHVETVPRIRLTSALDVVNKNYNDLNNKPQINGNTLSGNKTGGDLGLQNTLVSGSNIKTINSQSVVGAGNIDISAQATWGNIIGNLSNQSDLQAALDTKVNDVQVNGISKVSNNVANIETVQNLTSALSQEPLAASQGKLLNDRINNLMNIGRFLALWNCATGLPLTNPPTMPYTYKTGDYYRVNNVDSTTNYKPNGSSYTGAASSTVDTETVAEGAVYYFDGSVWKLQAAGGGGTVQDVQINGTSILSGGIANIPIATVNDSGVIKVGASFNTQTLQSGYMQAVVNTYSAYQGKGTDAFIGKGTLENVLDNEGVRPDKAQSLTDAQKAQAVHNIGLSTEDTTNNWSTYSGNADVVYVVEA